MAGGANPAAVAAPMAGGLAQVSQGATGGKGGGTPQAVAQPAIARPGPAAAPQIQQPTQPSVFNQSAGAYNAALTGTQAAAGMPNVGAFANPFTSQVINTSMDALNRSRQMAMNDLGAQATRARAFGGSRQGVAQAETNRAFADQAGQMAANLNMQGFNSALGAAQQQQQAQLAAAGQMGNLSNLGFGFGQQINQNMMQQGAMQQALQQQLIDAARGQFQGFTNAPQQALSLPLAALGAAPVPQTTTQSKQPGLFDYLTLAATAIGGCWVAREVYGAEDLRWLQFRQWLTRYAPDWLYNLYFKHGERFAGVVRKVPVLKRILRPLMDRARHAAGFAD